MQELLMYVLRRVECDDLGVDIPLLGFSSLGICRRRLSNHALMTATHEDIFSAILNLPANTHV